MLNIVDLVYVSHNDIDDPEKVIALHSPALGYTGFLNKNARITVVFHLNGEGDEMRDGIEFKWFKRGNAPWQIPLKTHRFIRSIDPDVVLVHGFIFPVQVIALRMALGKKCRIVLQHHADEPVASVRKIFQRLADNVIDAYLFTSLELAQPWLRHKVIRDKEKCVELLGASTSIRRKDKRLSREKLGMPEQEIFLWVGRLNRNKDPMTVLTGFQKHLQTNGNAHMYMIYQTEELLEEIISFIRSNGHLQSNVHLVGKVNNDISSWYSAADVFISGSHSESSGYALVEAMHCGCIPVVTAIPSFIKITENGRYGFLYQPGDAIDLLRKLTELKKDGLTQMSEHVHAHAVANLGYQNIAEQLFELFTRLTGRN